MRSLSLIFFACMAPNIVAYVDDPARANVQANFRNLFDSLARKDRGAVNETLKILNQEMTQGKQAFNSMNNWLPSALGRRSHVKEASVRHRRENLDGNGPSHPVTPDSHITEIVSIQPTEYWRPSSTGSLRGIPGEGTAWQKLRADGCLHADKSIYLERLLENPGGNIFFYMTRPRRFGKTSFLLMARFFFNGDERYFNGMQIDLRGNACFFKKPEDGGVPEELKGEKWIRCPVIHLDFREIVDFNTMAEFKVSYLRMLYRIARFYKLDASFYSAPGFDIVDLISELRLCFNVNVVVLVDEYDSPFQHAILKKKNKELAQEIRDFIDGVLGAIKTQILLLRLVLVLGVSRLGLTSLQQSGPNCYVDLTYKEDFAGAFGFTSKEIADFQPEIADRFDLNSKKGLEEFLSTLREQYDGYNFTFQYSDGEKKNVLNPVSTMKCLNEKKIGCYWTETNSVNEITRRLYFSKKPLEEWEHSKSRKRDIERIRNPASESIPLDILMLLYGYLTIESYDEGTDEVSLNFPNHEIRIALQEKIEQYDSSNDEFLNEQGWLIELKWHMDTGCLPGAMNSLQELFDSTDKLSVTLRQGMNEFSNTVRLLDKLRAAGISYREAVKFMKEESRTEELAGDVDVMTNKLQKNFIMSIKHGYPANKAMKQLIDYLQEYRAPFLAAINDPTEAWFVGISFDSKSGDTMHSWVGILFKNGALHFDQCDASPANLCDILRKENAK